MPVTDTLSIQLYTLRSLNDLGKVLDTVAAVGFRNVEGVGSHLDDAANVKTELSARVTVLLLARSLAALRERPDRWCRVQIAGVQSAVHAGRSAGTA